MQKAKEQSSTGSGMVVQWERLGSAHHRKIKPAPQWEESSPLPLSISPTDQAGLELLLSPPPAPKWWNAPPHTGNLGNCVHLN